VDSDARVFGRNICLTARSQEPLNPEAKQNRGFSAPHRAGWASGRSLGLTPLQIATSGLGNSSVTDETKLIRYMKLSTFLLLVSKNRLFLPTIQS
jgi:hypothetical protein